MSVSNAFKAAVAGIIFVSGLVVVAPAQANISQSCQGSDMVTFRRTFVLFNMQLVPSFEIDIHHDHPFCRAEK